MRLRSPAGPPSTGRRSHGLRNPAQVIVLAFAAATAVGTALLLLPAATPGPGHASLMEALFTATSAVCVTGHLVVNTATYWSVFGQVVILALIQVGGFGVMTLASLLGLLVSRRLGLRSRITAAAETRSIGIGDVRRVIVGVVLASLLLEALAAAALTTRFYFGYQEPAGQALWHGVFHAVSAFNNAGFSLFEDNLVDFAADPWICLPIAFAVIAGGLGFPVLLQLRREITRPRLWTLNTRLVLATTAALLVSSTAFITAMEWNNDDTLGKLSPGGRLLAGFFQAVITRTAGFNSVDIGALDSATWLGMDVLMFIGGGPAGTAGGLKVTTFAVLYFIIYSELRGDGAVNALGKRLPRSTHRQAATVALLAVAVVVTSTVALLIMTEFSLDRILFEVISAFATVGLSTGITPDLPVAGQLILVLLMFLGRVGPVTLASALALRHTTRLYELPKEQPIIG
ncbi:MAG TPA: potassium transporter TrkG [Jatrophihabitans sp.]|jgi:potassium uptake TrkH family protein|uniref:TrkH family potassium uptake protein n=1 Tax=Jatrophihabitans sp. TaxID=1932789 RepID=UPI002F040395